MGISVGATWQRPGPYRWPTRAGWRSGSGFRLSREETRTRIGSRCAAGGRSSRWPGATSRSTPGRGTRVGDKWTRLSLSTLLPRWAKLDIGSIRRVDVKTAIAAVARPVLANQVDTCAVVRAGGLCTRSSRRGGLTAEPASARPARERVPVYDDPGLVGPHGLELALPWHIFRSSSASSGKCGLMSHYATTLHGA